MVSKREAIANFLRLKTHADLASLYTPEMEVQVIVAQDDGERVVGEFHGARWSGFTKDGVTWKAFRIPRNADSEPVYEDSPMRWDLLDHAEGIGMTGWNWEKKVSQWVAYDFDGIVGHSDKHDRKSTPEELARVREAAQAIPWVSVRYSTSGKGLHLYVRLNDVPTNNHTEHAALARAILSQMSAMVGFDFAAKVDVCGGNMWVWHRKMLGTRGLELIKDGEVLHEVPADWQLHVNVVSGRARKIKHRIPNADTIPDVEDKFEQIVGQQSRVPLDTEHRNLINWLASNGRFGWWDSDGHMLVTHTRHLMDAHEALNLRGIFKSATAATELNEQNCFLFPMRRGAWAVRRYSRGTIEHPSWDQDSKGWTRCYLNLEPTMFTAAKTYGGMEDPSGGFVFQSPDEASKAALALGADVKFPLVTGNRDITFKQHKDGKRLVVEVDKITSDPQKDFQGWLPKGKKWVRIFNAQMDTASTDETDSESFDDFVRHLISPEDVDNGWVINSEAKWNEEPLNHVKIAMESTGLKPAQLKQILGKAVNKPWKLVVEPFQPEYPGDRKWNRKAPQFRYAPSLNEVLYYPTWKKILHHIGKYLDISVQSHPWCRDNGITTGADYLKCWIASMVQHPMQPLPYLFIFSERQNTGKSILHEALSLLIEPGVVDAGAALKSQGNFNGELQNAILCVVEEINISRNVVAYERIKTWVTSPKLSIHSKGETPYLVNNTTHWIHTANQKDACPIFPDDQRIVVINVAEPPTESIPKETMLHQLEKEAPDFLAEILRLELPPSNDRLRIPVIRTAAKDQAEAINKTALDYFIEESCHYYPGETIPLGEFYERFIAAIDPVERLKWSSKQSVSSAMPSKFPKGKLSSDSTWRWGNISFDPPPEFINMKNYLVAYNDKLIMFKPGE